MAKKKLVIVGAGPAGLTAAFEVLKSSDEIEPVILESTGRIGGISCTINHRGNRIDIGGHRFFSKSKKVMDWWLERMPLQGGPSRDDIELARAREWNPGGPDPEREDRVLLLRDRVSRIFYLRKFFDYPLSLRPITVYNLGVLRTALALLGYLYSSFVKLPDRDSLENFLINRFGRPLYRMFFESYTEKVWGYHPRFISAAWGAQRIKGLSLSKAIFQALKTGLRFGLSSSDLGQQKVETSLIERFLYPKFGPGQMWECVASDISNMGGMIQLNHKVTAIEVKGTRVVSVTASTKDGPVVYPCDFFISTMPIKDLISSMDSELISTDIRRVASGLPYRDFMTVGLLVERLKLTSKVDSMPAQRLISDNWIYVQEPDVRLCRIQIFNNWSPYLVADPSRVWLGLEYMCAEGDDIWNMDDTEFIDFAVNEVVKIGIIEPNHVLDSCRIKIEKAYPAYFGSYAEFDTVRQFLDTIGNLYCVGRNGQHRYNNQDHSMLTAMEAIELIVKGSADKEKLWKINTEEQYHETKD